ncbi:hypothetical protein [Rubellimicrobium roseum]|uniref:Uncharacterized protein n=1 Tax=Rubellimicrobium roseum TaxID=687525 RepID=A0A5C4N300_9RHOB|nr:hypothetical protein [Rubellimicrobium roseum]TNC58872.1 hypothetical protein FHG71_23275 [Rubellimicrobium roseum]
MTLRRRMERLEANLRTHQADPVRVIWLVGVERQSEEMVEVAPAVAMVLAGPFGPGETLAQEDGEEESAFAGRVEAAVLRHHGPRTGGGPRGSRAVVLERDAEDL